MYSCIFLLLLLLSTSILSANNQEQELITTIQSSSESWGFSKHEKVKEILNKGVSPDAQQHGQSALYIACEKGESRIAELLLERGADPIEKDEDGMTPVWRAVVGGHRSIFDLLVNKKVPLHVVHRDKSTLLHMAAGAGAHPDSEVVAKILETKATDPNVVDKDGCTPLMFAVRTNLAIVNQLLAAGADPQREDRFGKTVLQHAQKGSVLDQEKIVAALTDALRQQVS